MTENEPRIFKYGMTGRRITVIVLLVVPALALIALVWTGIILNKMDSMSRFSAFIPLLAIPIGLVWRRSEMPHVRVTDEELTIFRGISEPPVFWRWEDIDSVKLLGKKGLWLKPRKGPRVTIKLMWIPRENREELVEIVTSRVEAAKGA